jgi:cellulose synthase (UDP-forming)
VRAFLPLRPRRRRSPRSLSPAPLALVGRSGRRRALRVDASAGGLGILLLGRAPLPAGTAIPLLAPGGVAWTRVAHARRVLPGVWRIGLAYLPGPVAERCDAYLAA